MCCPRVNIRLVWIMIAHRRHSVRKRIHGKTRLDTAISPKCCHRLLSNKEHLLTQGINMTGSNCLSGDHFSILTCCIKSALGDSLEFTPVEINPFCCQARIWADGVGGQCSYAPLSGSTLCAAHNVLSGSAELPTHGFVTGEIPSRKLLEFKRVQAFRLSQSLGQLVYLEDRFHQIAKDRLVTFCNEFISKRSMYPVPFIGIIACEFVGKMGTNYSEIRCNDIVCFKWSYTCRPKANVVIAGSKYIYHNANHNAIGRLSLRAKSLMMDIICVAKIYEQLSAENAPFMRRHCNGEINADIGCGLVAIGSPKSVSTMPVQKEFVDKHGNSAMWIICAQVGKTNTVLCHPGASFRHATNRLSYLVSELKWFDMDKDTPASSELYKRRRRKVCSSSKVYKFPSTLEDVNSGLHEGLCFVMAYAVALAEFSIMPSDYTREVQFDRAMACFELNPFQWQCCGHWNRHVVIVWRSVDGNVHLRCGRLSYFMRLVSQGTLKFRKATDLQNETAALVH